MCVQGSRANGRQKRSRNAGQLEEGVRERHIPRHDLFNSDPHLVNFGHQIDNLSIASSQPCQASKTYRPKRAPCPSKLS
mgnify:CR=1 FL=1